MNFKFVFLQKGSIDRKFFESAEDLTDASLIENNIIDFPSSSILIRKLNTKNVQFLPIMDFVEVCFVVPKQPHKINKLLTQFEIFDFKSHMICLSSMIILIIIWCLIEFIRSKRGIKYDSVPDILLFIGQAQNNCSIKKFSKFNNRGIIILIVFFYFVVCTTYTSNIASYLVYQPKTKEIDTLEEVDRSGLDLMETIIGVLRPTAENIKNNSIIYRLANKPIRFIDIRYFHMRFNTSQKTAILTRTLNAEYIIALFFDERTGKDIFHLVKEKLFKFHRSFMIPKNSPYTERFTQILNRLIESGFVDFEKFDVTKMIYLKYINRIKLGFCLEPGVVVIKMEHLDQLISFWIGFLLIATFVFILEIVFNYFYKNGNKTRSTWRIWKFCQKRASQDPLHNRVYRQFSKSSVCFYL